MDKKEIAEGKQLEIFIKLFNERYKTDYIISCPEPQNSIADRKAISKSGKRPDIVIQIKDIKELDTSPFTESIMGKGVKVFDLNIFKLLTPKLQKIEKKYGIGAKGVVLVLNLGVSEDWMRDYDIPKNFIEQTNFRGIYCFGLPSNITGSGYIFPLKDIIDL